MIGNLLLRISLKGKLSSSIVFFTWISLLWAGRPSVSKNGILVRRRRPGTKPSKKSSYTLSFFEMTIKSKAWLLSPGNSHMSVPCPIKKRKTSPPPSNLTLTRSPRPLPAQ